jgi:hypothetical protein
VVVGMAALWLALVVVETWHRADPFIHPPGRRPSGEPTPYRRNVRRTLEGDFGGDLTRMLGFPAWSRRFGVPRGCIEVVTDRRGYRNEPHLADLCCPVVVTGDSYMDQGLTNADTPAGQLRRLLGVPVYDQSQMAAGPCEGVHRVLSDAKFRRQPPEVIVWGFIERNLFGRRFVPWPPPSDEPQEPESFTGRLEGLRQRANSVPRQVETWLTRWSLLKRWAIALRAEAAWRLFGELLTDKVIMGHRPGGVMLFLRGSVRRLARTPKQRKTGRIAEAVASVHAECQRRGIHLVVLLIPDKGHVYRRFLPPEERPAIPEPNVLAALEARLEPRGVHVVDLLPLFLSRNGPEEPLLYYPDDTHWSDHGIRAAMEAVAAELHQRGVRLSKGSTR